jgi:GNAT superfamily N-acetyltransferase
MEIKIRQVVAVTQEVVTAFEQLTPQLTNARTLPTMDELNAIVHSGSAFLFVAEEDEKIAGTITLVTYRTPSGMKAWIEDVVVDESQRGKGIGKKLVRFILDYAKETGIQKIDLTSNPHRIAANELYQKMGFVKRETNVYRFE